MSLYYAKLSKEIQMPEFSGESMISSLEARGIPTVASDKATETWLGARHELNNWQLN
jgi:hypothetical protein